MNILLFVIVFILAIDEFSFTQAIHRPLVASLIIGLLFGDVKSALIIGAYLEIASLSFEESFYLNHRKSLVLASAVSSALAASGTMSTQEVMALAVSLILIGSALSHVIDLITVIFLPMARNNAEKGKSVFIYQLLSIIIRGLIYGAFASYLYAQGASIQTLLSNITTNYSWVMNAFAIVGILLPALGIAVLMRNISVKDNYGVFFAGIAVATIVFFTTNNTYATLVLVGMIAFGIFYYDFNNQKENSVEKSTTKGGAEKWW